MKSQRGGFVVGFLVGLLVGLALALGVALYVTKVPVPFVNKVPQRTAEQDAAEAERNKNWDPNAPLAGRNAARSPSGAASGTVSVMPPAASTPPVAARPAASGSARDPAAILAERAPPAGTTAAGKPVAPTPAADPFAYYVQAGAYGRAEDAEQQRARLAMQGFEAKVTEREQAGKTVYRVRIGPFDRKDAADGTKDRLASSGIDAALVRVQK